MSKTKIAYVCADCGAEYNKWQGQCHQCQAWNTLAEIKLKPNLPRAKTASNKGYAGVLSPQVTSLSEISLDQVPRFSTTFSEFDRVLGGGMVPGSAVLLGGHPGAGKSTLLLQTACRLAVNKKILYVTGEESLSQIALRAHRLQLPLSHVRLLAETCVETILSVADQEQPDILIIDSIQTTYTEEIQAAPGGVSQVRESAAALIRFAKSSQTVLLLVGHVTKDGTLAGPKVLEHMIDASLLLEGAMDSNYRTLRGQKNRFGAVNELGVFAMLEQGLKEVKNPSALFLSRGVQATAGSLVMVIWEGTRPLLVEIQALVDESQLSAPRRIAIGLDNQRLVMLLAVLHRHGALFTGDQDVFLNVVGGVRVMETSADLALVLAVVSSLKNEVLAQDLVVFGEVGLTGEIRPVTNGQGRLTEAAKHGFKKAIVPRANMPKKPIENMQIFPVETLSQALALVPELSPVKMTSPLDAS